MTIPELIKQNTIRGDALSLITAKALDALTKQLKDALYVGGMNCLYCVHREEEHNGCGLVQDSCTNCLFDCNCSGCKEASNFLLNYDTDYPDYDDV